MGKVIGEKGQYQPEMCRIAVYGGADIDKSVVSFCKAFGAALARQPDLKIITGGYRGRKKKPEKQTTDWSVVQGIISGNNSWHKGHPRDNRSGFCH